MYATTIHWSTVKQDTQRAGAWEEGPWEEQGPSLGHCWRLANLQYVPQALREVDMVRDGEDGGKKMELKVLYSNMWLDVLFMSYCGSTTLAFITQLEWVLM